MPNPLESLLGGPGTPVQCREIADGTASVHFWAAGVEPGDMCLCGTNPYRVSLPTKGDGTNDAPSCPDFGCDVLAYFAVLTVGVACLAVELWWDQHKKRDDW